MRYSISLSLMLLAAGLATVTSLPAALTATAGRGPIAIAELRTRGVAGDLGEQLGTILTVRGIVSDSGDKGRETCLQVDRVGDHKLPKPVLLPLSLDDFAEPKLEMPTKGQLVTCVGWETGGYRGSVEGQEKYLPPLQEQSYHFHNHFVVVRIVR